MVGRVERAFDSGEGYETVEVDVVGVSMGGLVARFAAIDSGGVHKRLVIKRLFTISTPHRGAELAALPTADRKQLGMRAGSAFLAALYAAEQGYEIVPYARLGDVIVGVENCAPEGEVPIWVRNRFLEPAHMAAQRDPRFTADIARRVRGEAPYATQPRVELPE
jgi:pimeloyl-ACP methyl ester carboxylesterase